MNHSDQIARRLVDPEAMLPTPWGTFTISAFSGNDTEDHHVALSYGDVRGKSAVLVRLHSECLTGDVFGSYRCDCGEQLKAALRQISESGAGVILYLRQEGRGIGIANKIRAYCLQEEGMNTVETNKLLGFPADMRTYGSAAGKLKELSIHEVRLLTNNPAKIEALEEHGIKVVSRVPLEVYAKPENWNYLETKRTEMNHMLNLDRQPMESLSDEV
ncbi:MAG: GTP cyclohydrolase II [Gammaproteobacteria bacterium]|nr:GTP cyclohydrolase II [Gammaproteobacteria bacterium]